MSTETPATKIVIVAGQEFSVPSDTTEKALRDHLAVTFPDVASATVQKGTRTIEGVTYETIEFVKRAGTKGAANLAPLLAEIPPLRIGAPPASTRQLLADVKRGKCTFAEALDADLATILSHIPENRIRVSGATLCAQLDQLSPVAGDDASAW